MTAGGVIGQLERSAAQAIDNSGSELEQTTVLAVQTHEARTATAVRDATLQYFKGKNGKALKPEDLALLHYVQSGGEGLPGEDQLVPRVEAAEKVFEVVMAADMLLVPNIASDHVSLAKQPASIKRRKITMGSEYMRAKDNGEEGSPYGGAYLNLPGLSWTHVFNLIGRDDLTTPIDTVEGVDDLFEERKAEIIEEDGSIFSGPYLPLVAGSIAVRRFAVNLGAEVPVAEQYMNTEYWPSDRSFYGLARKLAEIDPEMGGEVVEEVRERQPAMLGKIGEGLREDLDHALDALLEREPRDHTRILKWFERSDIALFYTPKELQAIRKELVGTFEEQLNERTAAQTAALSKALKI